jgi:hypothetical protein
VIKKIILISVFFPFSLAAIAKENIQSYRLKDIAAKAISYALSTQVQSPDTYYLKGEYPTQIESTLIPIIVGVGKPIGKDQEATAFTTASVINVLSEVYLEHPELQSEAPFNQIPDSIREGIQTFSRYQSDDTFNFYPSMIDDGVKVHRPVDMKLLPIWLGFTNIPNDADTSSAALAALLFDAKINHKSFEIPPKALSDFSKFRDVDRKAMFYNKGKGIQNTGGFMTWLFDEDDPAMPRFFFAKAKDGTRIPFNRNDVDCVVNANVLKMLALAKRGDIAGHDETCSMLNSMIDQDQHATCGVYYPNTMNLSFSLASAEKAGETCLTEQSHQKIVNKILSIQSEDGSWQNDKNIWQDPVLTTSFAMFALLHFGDIKESRVQGSLRFGAHYLLASMKQKDGQFYWPADHFFTATALARSLIMWSSKAYTNVIIASVLLELENKYPGSTVKDFMF